MTTEQALAEEDTKKLDSSGSGDPDPNIPLRLRRLPASFWQEPSAIKPATRDNSPPSTALPLPLGLHRLHPPQSWTMHPPSMVLPHRLLIPSYFSPPHLASYPQWMGSSGFCGCSSCLNYLSAMPRLHTEATERCRLSVPNSSATSCTDQSCKLCNAASDHWHPDRLRYLRLRAARYNAILD